MTEVAIRAKVRLQNAHIAKVVDSYGTVKAAAEAVGVSNTTLSKWLNFKSTPRHRVHGNARIKKAVRKLCKLAGATLEEVFPSLTKEERGLLAKEHVRDAVMDTHQLTSNVEMQYLSYEPDLDRAIDAEALKGPIAEVLSKLPERERQIIELRYGLGDADRVHTLAEVANIQGVGKERIRQLEMRALRAMQQPSQASQLVEFIDSTVPAERPRCAICHERFRTEHALKLHCISAHDGLTRRVRCRFCYAEFRSKQALDNHEACYRRSH
jgi:RNA polymerase sigma factor (sigma-70 family)